MNSAEVKKIQEQNFHQTIIGIREKNFKQNIPFLILSGELTNDLSYLEYADGHIEIQQVYLDNEEIKSRVIRTLSDVEANKIRAANGLQ